MNIIKQYVNSTKQCINSDPCEVTVHAQKKKKIKKKRGREKTRKPNGHIEVKL